MSNIIIVFASMTGNTEEMAEAVAAGMAETVQRLELKDVMDTDVEDLKEYDGVLLGAYTWGDGELPDEFLDFYEELDDLNLSGMPAAVFGSCDSSYPFYGAAVDTLDEKLRELGADLLLDGLKVELTPSEEEREICKQFGRSFAAHFTSVR